MDKRITELEIKVAYQEDTIQQLDHVICQQQDQIDSLKKQMTQLIKNAQQATEEGRHLLSDSNDVPPHY
ncbi:MAG: SlyX family protein [Cycloclasticus sp.]